jgi:hypothetical protein
MEGGMPVSLRVYCLLHLFLGMLDSEEGFTALLFFVGDVGRVSLKKRNDFFQGDCSDGPNTTKQENDTWNKKYRLSSAAGP